MLQNIVFQDNLYQLTRSIEGVHEGLMLNLHPEYFHKKIMADILFFDTCITRIQSDIQQNSKLSGYIYLMKAIYSCQEKFIGLLDFILQKNTPIADVFNNDMEKLKPIRSRHVSLKNESSEKITKAERSSDSRDIVSVSELSELLNFANP